MVESALPCKPDTNRVPFVRVAEFPPRVDVAAFQFPFLSLFFAPRAGEVTDDAALYAGQKLRLAMDVAGWLGVIAFFHHFFRYGKEQFIFLFPTQYIEERLFDLAGHVATPVEERPVGDGEGFSGFDYCFHMMVPCFAVGLDVQRTAFSDSTVIPWLRACFSLLFVTFWYVRWFCAFLLPL